MKFLDFTGVSSGKMIIVTENLWRSQSMRVTEMLCGSAHRPAPPMPWKVRQAIMDFISWDQPQPREKEKKRR